MTAQLKSAKAIASESALDRPLTVTFFPSIFARKKSTETLTLNQIADKIESTSGESKADLPWLKLGEFGNEKSPKGSMRHDANFLCFDGVEADYDGGELTIFEARRRLKKAGIAAIVYTSASHTLLEPRFRILCPCSKTFSPDDRARFIARLNGLLDGRLDAVSFTKSQSFYFGKVEDCEDFSVHRVEGRYIDLADDLDATAIGKRGTTDDGETDYERDDSGSGEAFRKAIQLHLAGDTIEAFEEWAIDNPWNDYQSNPERAIERTWDRAGVEAGKIALQERREPLDFEDLGPDPDAPQSFKGLDIISASDIVPEAIDWIQPKRLARGKITILAGDPGQGKSQISIDIAARITMGRKWPDGGRARLGSVLFLSAEDGAADTVVPRLIAAKANLKKVKLVRGAVDKGKNRTFNLREDLARLDAACAEIGDVALVIIDPVTSYLGETDSHRTSDVRAVLEPLAAWAEKRGVAVLAISHPPKAAQAKAINAVTGSLAFVAAARMVFVAIADSAVEGRSLLLPVKSNIGPMASGIGYRIEGHIVADGIETSAIAWDSDPVTVTADEALALAREAGKPPKASDAAENYLRDKLGFGPRPAKDVIAKAEAEGISEKTLRRAKEKMGIIADRKGYGKGGSYVWRLPESGEQCPV